MIQYIYIYIYEFMNISFPFLFETDLWAIMEKEKIHGLFWATKPLTCLWFCLGFARVVFIISVFIQNCWEIKDSFLFSFMSQRDFKSRSKYTCKQKDTSETEKKNTSFWLFWFFGKLHHIICWLWNLIFQRINWK